MNTQCTIDTNLQQLAKIIPLKGHCYPHFNDMGMGFKGVSLYAQNQDLTPDRTC